MLWPALSAVCALMLGSASVNAAGQWDGFVRVPAFAAGPGQWVTCDRGAAFPFTAAGRQPERRCVRRTLVRERPGGDTRVLPLQALLELHAAPVNGYRLVAVGPLPALHEGLGVNTIDPASIFIAYRLEPR